MEACASQLTNPSIIYQTDSDFKGCDVYHKIDSHISPRSHKQTMYKSVELILFWAEQQGKCCWGIFLYFAKIGRYYKHSLSNNINTYNKYFTRYHTGENTVIEAFISENGLSLSENSFFLHLLSCPWMLKAVCWNDLRGQI